MSNPPSNINRKKKTSITPNSKGSVGKVKAANSLNSIVNESGMKNRIKKTSLSNATSEANTIRTTSGKTGRK
jgi:hypothetical protein